MLPTRLESAAPPPATACKSARAAASIPAPVASTANGFSAVRRPSTHSRAKVPGPEEERRAGGDEGAHLLGRPRGGVADPVGRPGQVHSEGGYPVRPAARQGRQSRKF